MPHFILEHSPDIPGDQISDTLDALFAAASDHPEFPDPAAIKMRALPCAQQRMAGKVHSFAHLTIKLLTGRDTPTKATLAKNMLMVLDAQLPQVGQLTVDPRDMARDTYAKRIL